MGPLYLTGGYATSDATAPGSIAQYAFLDTGTPSRITSSTIATSQTTTSATYANLASTGPSVTLVVPQSGEVKVDFSARANHSAAGQNLYVSFALSGANTMAASDTTAAQIRQMATSPGNLVGTLSRSIHLTGLTPGTTTFTLTYRTTAATAIFADRHLIVTPCP